MSARRVAVVRGGEVPQGSTYKPMEWDATDPRVAAAMAYRPNHRPDQWPRHADVVRDLVLRVEHEPLDPLRDRHWLGTGHHFWSWAEDNGHPTEPAALLADPFITNFVSETWENPRTRATHQYRLRDIAAVVFPVPRYTRIPRSAPAAPHTDEQAQAFLKDADSLVAGRYSNLKTRVDLHRDVTVVLALTFGAGCTSEHVHRMRSRDLDDRPDGLWLSKPGAPMSIPVAEPWAGHLRAALTGDPDAWLLSPDSTGKRNERVGKVMAKARDKEPGLCGFDCDRAAKTWQTALLATIGFDVVAAMCGYRPGSQLPGDLVPHLPERTLASAETLARRWSA